MMFLESPLPILIVGLVLEGMLAIALFRTGRGKLLWAMGGVALVVLLGVLIAQHTVTDTKRVRQTLQDAAAGLVAGDASRVSSCIVPDSDGDAARTETRNVLGQFRFHELDIRNLDVKFNYHASPPTANTTFSVIVRGRFRKGSDDQGEINYPVSMEVQLRRESGRWLIYDLPKYDVRY
jgi:hypothetical protein